MGIVIIAHGLDQTIGRGANQILIKETKDKVQGKITQHNHWQKIKGLLVLLHQDLVDHHFYRGSRPHAQGRHGNGKQQCHTHGFHMWPQIGPKSAECFESFHKPFSKPRLALMRPEFCTSNSNSSLIGVKARGLCQR